MNLEEFIDFLYSLDPTLSIGVHGIGKKRKESNKNLTTREIAEKILKEGLDANGGWGILGTVFPFGKIGELSDILLQEIIEYVYMADGAEIVNVLFAFPESITTSDGEEVYLGHYDFTHESNKKDGKYSKLPLNTLTALLGYIPREFIVGYYVTKWDSHEFKFVKNPDFFMFKQSDFADKLRELMKKYTIFSGQELLKYEQLFPNLQGYTDMFLLEQYKASLGKKKEIN